MAIAGCRGTPLASMASMNTGNLENEHQDQAGLISGVLSDARDLAVAEVDKLKAEAITKAKDVGSEIRLASIGLLILTVAAILLGEAIALALVAAGLPAWLAFAIVAAACAITGIVFLKRYVLDNADKAVDAANQAVDRVGHELGASGH